MKAIEQRRRMRGQGGFTLIELLVVIAILAVLAAVVVFAVGGITNNSKESACRIERRTVLTAVGAYKAQKGEDPPDLQTLVDSDLLEDLPTLVNYDGAGGVTYVDTLGGGGEC